MNTENHPKEQSVLAMSNEYIIEIEVYDRDNRRMAILSITKSMKHAVGLGHYLIIHDLWRRISEIIHDVDDGETIISLEREMVSKNEFSHQIDSMILKGWKLIKEDNI